MDRLDGCLVALLVTEGVRRRRVQELAARLRALGARIHFLALHPPPVHAEDGAEFAIDATATEIAPHYYDGLLVPDCRSVESLLAHADAPAELVRQFLKEERPLGAIGLGVALLAHAGVVAGGRVACEPSIEERVRQAGGLPVSDDIVSDGLLTTGRSGCDLRELCDQFATNLHALRMPDLVDEISRESFPASDAHSGASAMPG